MFYFHVDVLRNVKSFDMPHSHFHKYYEIYFLLDGNREYFIDDKLYKISKGDVILIAPNVLHKTISVDSGLHTRALINFSESFLSPKIRGDLLSCFDARHMKIPKNRTEYIENLLEKALHEYQKNDLYSSELVKCYITEILAFLSRTAKNKKNIYIPDDINESIKKATSYIKNNYHKDITLADAAKRANMSRTYFSVKFKQCTGFGFSEFLNSVRIMNSQNFLTTTSLNITEIATACGFNDSNYFARQFKKMNGVTPLKYRKSHLI